MTRKHFKALATALYERRPGENWDANKRVQWNHDVLAVAKVCQSFNPLFSDASFLAACGGLHNV